MQLRRPKTPGELLNITPLIDVVFILLVFFMLATNFARYRMIGVDAPKEAEVVRDSQGAVVIRLEAGGTIAVDGDRLDGTTVEAAVAEILVLDPNRAFIVRPLAGVSLQSAITAYDDARRAGARKVSFSKAHGEEGR